ncbi:MAG: hydantoinase B/oxoprolinase family protein, partial [Haloferacaceae archaeon]
HRPGKATRELPPGSTVSVRTPGAGGYGPAEARDPDAVRRDLRLDEISPAAAREAYGLDVAGTEGGAADERD